MVSDLQKQVSADRPDLPIIFITGHGDVPMSVRAMKAGAVEFLTKPFRDDVLLSAIRSAVDRSEAAQADTAELGRSGSVTPRSAAANARSWGWSWPAC